METFRERTLATRYQPRQQLPPNFPEILKEYAREVLREQPEDILAWSADYFRQLALEADPFQPQQQQQQSLVSQQNSTSADDKEAVLAQKMTEAFTADPECQNGAIPAATADRLLRESFGLAPAQVLYLMTSPTTVVKEDGMIDIEPFCQNSARPVQHFQAMSGDFEISGEEDENTTVHGLNRKDVEGDFFRMFRMLDEAQTGLLPFADYYNALANAPYHLTQRDIRALCLQCERDEQDMVNYETERSRWYDLLRLTEQFELFDAEGSKKVSA